MSRYWAKLLFSQRPLKIDPGPSMQTAGFLELSNVLCDNLINHFTAFRRKESLLVFWFRPEAALRSLRWQLFGFAVSKKSENPAKMAHFISLGK